MTLYCAFCARQIQWYEDYEVVVPKGREERLFFHNTREGDCFDQWEAQNNDNIT